MKHVEHICMDGVYVVLSDDESFGNQPNFRIGMGASIQRHSSTEDPARKPPSRQSSASVCVMAA